jgi:hypothetical protein
MSKKIILLDNRYFQEEERKKIERMVNSVDASVILANFPSTDFRMIKIIDIGKL